MLQFGWEKISRVLCLGAHADDIEIGCGGTLLRMQQEAQIEVEWHVFSGAGARREEARASAARFLTGAARSQVEVYDFRDSFFPVAYADIKESFASLARRFSPDVIFTHRRDDAHQDHRVLAELTWCAFRNHLILEYEIPKYEGDLGQPNVYVPFGSAILSAKVNALLEAFPTQRSKPWFSAETFEGLARIRGIESGAKSHYAEGFYARKLVL